MSTTFSSEEITRHFDERWDEQQLEELLENSNYKVLRKSKNDFMSFVSHKKWDKIHFHFEVRWGSSELNIRIHLESQFISEEIDREARTFFAKHGYAIKGNTFKNLPGEKLEESVHPDFSSKEAAKRTIQEIIDIFDSPAYQKCAELAEEFIDSLDKE